MSSKPASTSKLRTALRWGLISLVVIGVTWVAVIAWWQMTKRVVTTEDALAYLIGLPLCILLCIVVCRWRIVCNRNRHDSSGAKAAAAAAAPSPSNAVEHAAAVAPRLPILAAWTATSLAQHGDDFIQALAEKRTRPTPDELLTDEHGFPILSGRVKDLDTAVVQQSLMRAIADGHLENAVSAEDWRAAVIRALALVGTVMDQVQMEWPLHADTGAPATAGQAAAAPILRGSAGLPQVLVKPLLLQVKLLVSSDFTPDEQRFARAYITEHLSALPISSQQMQVEVVPAHDDTKALALADQFNLGSTHDTNPQALLLLACDSMLCPTVVEEWESDGRLFNMRRPNGLMPGEAAFGVLSANEKALQTASADPICRLSRLHTGKRDSSADAPGKASHTCLAETIDTTLKTAGIPGEAIGTTVCDADHRTNRVLECIGAIMDRTPQLDAIQNQLAVNEACGHLGAASSLGLLAAGAIQCSDAGHPVLLFNVGHVTDRAAAVLIPADGFAAATTPSNLQAA